jgi:thymidine kinase
MSTVENPTGIPVDIGEVDVSPSRGRIEVIDGCMSSGKSRELIRRLNIFKHSVNAQIASGLLIPNTSYEDYLVVFKPSLDNRRGEDTVNSRDGDRLSAVSVKEMKDIVSYIANHPHLKVVALDEAQFFNANELLLTCTMLADVKNMRVIVAGLTKDFKGDNWGGVNELGSIADEHVHLTAACAICGETATMTQRLKKLPGSNNWEPASRNDPVEMVGEENYQARCRKHHQVSD